MKAQAKSDPLFFIFIKYWLPVIIWGFIIFSFSSQPTGSVSEVHWQDFLLKKSAHIFEYGVFSMLLYRALKESGLKIRKALLLAFVIACFYGITDEFHQSFTPGREPTIRDILFDSFGAGFSLFVVSEILPKTPDPIKKFAKELNVL